MSEESDSTESMGSRDVSLSDENDGENQEQEFTQVDAAARDHSYLPGTSNPLFPASLLEQRRKQQRGSKIRDSSLQQLAILELEGVVLFPGCTLPLRLRDSPWVGYLGRKIDASRDFLTPNEEVRIGVVTHLRSGRVQQQRRRPSRMRTSFTTGSGQRQQRALVPPDPGILQEDEEDDGDDEDEEEGSIEERDGEDEDDEEIQDRQEEAYHSTRDDSTPVAPALQQPVNDARNMEEAMARMDVALDQVHESLTTALFNVHDMLSVIPTLERLAQAVRAFNEMRNASIPETLSYLRQSIERSDHPVDQNFLDIVGQHASRIEFHRARFYRIFAAHAQTTDCDSLIGRIGTMATISYTFDEASDVLTIGTSPSPRHEARDQLVVTALGTNRFRVVSRVEGDDGNASSHRPFHANGMLSQVRLYWVEELPDHREFPLPRILVRSQRLSPLLTTLSDYHDTDNLYFHEQEQMIRKLSTVSSVPYIAYKSVWPWRLVGLIRTALDRIPAFEGLRKNLFSLQSHDSLLEPTSFSFWMASNMSLKEEEKLDLLKMPCTVERLRFILAKVLEQEDKETSVCCSACYSRLSSASSMFSIGGAEGTTGAYVNVHGVVHQTITLREADESRLAYSGGPEIRGCWFPGYSWTITHCQRCFAHLGWKFQLVRADATENRPEHFFGLSASSVTFVSS